MHWRYSLKADALPLFLLPLTDAQSTAQLTQHYLRLVLSQLINQRRLGLTGLLFLLQGDQDTWKASLHSVFFSCQTTGSMLCSWHAVLAMPTP